MRLNSTGLGVGVGPTAKLDVYQATLGTAYFRGGYSARQLTLTATSDGVNDGAIHTFSIGSGAGQFLFANSGGTRLTIDASGNVGVSVTPNALANAIRLEIGGALSSNLTLRSTSTSSSARNWMVAANVNTFGDFVIRQGNSQGAEPNSGTDRLVIDLNGNPIFTPSATPATLTTNGQLTVNATSNTNLRFSYRGSDGTTRVANITLA